MLVPLKLFLKTSGHFGVLEKFLHKHPDRNSNNNKRLQTFVILNAKDSNPEGKCRDSKLGQICPSSAKTAERYFRVQLGRIAHTFPGKVTYRCISATSEMKIKYRTVVIYLKKKKQQGVIKTI